MKKGMQGSLEGRQCKRAKKVHKNALHISLCLLRLQLRLFSPEILAFYSHSRVVIKIESYSPLQQEQVNAAKFVKFLGNSRPGQVQILVPQPPILNHSFIHLQIFNKFLLFQSIFLHAGTSAVNKNVPCVNETYITEKDTHTQKINFIK